MYYLISYRGHRFCSLTLQSDKEKFTTELLYLQSDSSNANAYDNPNRPGVSGHWRVQKDLDTIWKAANPGLAAVAACGGITGGTE